MREERERGRERERERGRQILFVFVPFVLFASSKSLVAPPFLFGKQFTPLKGKKRTITRLLGPNVWPLTTDSSENVC